MVYEQREWFPASVVPDSNTECFMIIEADISDDFPADANESPKLRMGHFDAEHKDWFISPANDPEIYDGYLKDNFIIEGIGLHVNMWRYL
jgi:hypothetical protein